MKNYFKNRLLNPCTYAGLASSITATLHLSDSVDVSNTMALVTAAFMGLLAALIPGIHK